MQNNSWKRDILEINFSWAKYVCSVGAVAKKPVHFGSWDQSKDIKIMSLPDSFVASSSEVSEAFNITVFKHFSLSSLFSSNASFRNESLMGLENLAAPVF